MASCSKDEELKEESEDLLIFATISDGEGDLYIKLTGYIRQAHSQSVLAEAPSSPARLARS